MMNSREPIGRRSSKRDRLRRRNEDQFDNPSWIQLHEEDYEEIHGVRLLDKQQRLEPALQELHDRVVQFAIRLADSFKTAFTEELGTYRARGGKVSEQIEQYLRDNKLVHPHIDILNRAQFESLLEAINYPPYPPDKGDSLYVVYQLPKPLAHFFFKFDKEAHNPRRTEAQFLRRPRMIEWGYLYFRVHNNAIYEMRERLAKELDLGMIRVNPIHKHDPNNYYYIWKIEPAEASKESDRWAQEKAYWREVWYNSSDDNAGQYAEIAAK